MLGALEKVTMWGVTVCASVLEKIKKGRTDAKHRRALPDGVIGLFKWLNRFYAGLAWIDARIMPGALSTVLLIKARKKK